MVRNMPAKMAATSGWGGRRMVGVADRARGDERGTARPGGQHRRAHGRARRRPGRRWPRRRQRGRRGCACPSTRMGRHALASSSASPAAALLAGEDALVQQVEDGEHAARWPAPRGSEAQRPEEGHAEQEAEEQRRVAERRQAARRCSTTTKMKNTTMWATCAALLVGAQQRADAAAWRRRSSPPGGPAPPPRRGARCSTAGRASDVAGHVHAARDHEEAAQQGDEGERIPRRLWTRAAGSWPAYRPTPRAGRAAAAMASLLRLLAQNAGAAGGRGPGRGGRRRRGAIQSGARHEAGSVMHAWACAHHSKKRGVSGSCTRITEPRPRRRGVQLMHGASRPWPRRPARASGTVLTASKRRI